MREAQLLEGAIDRIVRHRESELLIQPHDEIATGPRLSRVPDLQPKSGFGANELCRVMGLPGKPTASMARKVRAIIANSRNRRLLRERSHQNIPGLTELFQGKLTPDA
jgi:hypothetical protein